MNKEQLIKLKKEIIFVTSNKGKVASAERLLKDIKLDIFDYDLIEPRSDDVREIAEYKVKEAFELVQKPCIALDAGFFIDALNGFPKTFVKFVLETLGVEGILKQMQGTSNRKCAFQECLAYYDGTHLLHFQGIHEGYLATEKRGNDTNQKWSDLWYIFIPYGYTKTLAEMNEQERNNRIRNEHNTSALEEFRDYYQKTKTLIR